MNEGRHIPNPGKGQSINNQGLATKLKRARTPGVEYAFHSINPGAPIISLQITHTDEDTKDLELRG